LGTDTQAESTVKQKGFSGKWEENGPLTEKKEKARSTSQEQLRNRKTKKWGLAERRNRGAGEVKSRESSSSAAKGPVHLDFEKETAHPEKERRRI